jgi:hypothetical protein
MLHKLEEDYERRLRNIEDSIACRFNEQSQRCLDMLAQAERRREEAGERMRIWNDKMERKVKEVVEQNVSIKIQLDSYKTKQLNTDR